jgi:uncharacterized protein (DUF983 family)
MSDTTSDLQQRPPAVTIICILGFIGVFFLIPKVFSSVARDISAWYPFYLAFAAVAGLICNIGFWKMKKWGFYGYVAFVALNQVVTYSTGTWLPMALIAPAIIIAILAYYFRRMT